MLDAQSSPVRGGITDQPVDIVARLDAAEIKPPFSKPWAKTKTTGDADASILLQSVCERTTAAE
jgi:hypothetical protein